jgi:hypothetical protein
MTSPFPGMDPYVEPHWRDVHTTFMGDARRILNRSLPPGLIARVEERIAVESGDDYTHGIGPDVRVFSPSTSDPNEGKGGVVIDAPFKLVVDLDPLIERSIRIIDEGGTLITVIEFLSPTNKRQPGMADYLTKRYELLTGGVHVVEVDLIRAGGWRALMRPQQCPAEAVTTYRAVIRTSGGKPDAYLFPISIRQSLPHIPIPLRSGEPPVKLPLQSLFDGVYEDGRYDQTTEYTVQLDPPLHPEDAAWADQLLKSAGKR